jgi:hypothetical protein
MTKYTYSNKKINKKKKHKTRKTYHTKRITRKRQILKGSGMSISRDTHIEINRLEDEMQTYILQRNEIEQRIQLLINKLNDRKKQLAKLREMQLTLSFRKKYNQRMINRNAQLEREIISANPLHERGNDTITSLKKETPIEESQNEISDNIRENAQIEQGIRRLENKMIRILDMIRLNERVLLMNTNLINVCSERLQELREYNL